MKKRILIFSIAYEPYVGGAELAVRNITDRLSSYPPPYEVSPDTVSLSEKKADPSPALPKEGGYHFDLITSKFKRSDKEFEKIGNVNVYRVGFGSRLGRYLYPWFAFRLAKKLHKKNKYQAVWSIMAAYAAGAALLFLNKHKRIPFLLTLQEGDAIEHIHRRVRFFKSAWKDVFRRADCIQAISTFLADWARQEGAVCPIEVIPNGVDLDKFNANIANQNADGTNSSPGSRFTIITTSRLVRKNGIDTLIKAVARLKAKKLQATSCQLQILGDGKERAKLERLAKDEGVDEVVQFLGHVDPDKLPEYLAEADIFVRPSRSEGLGISFLEAMAASLPVIATNVGGIPDFLRDGMTGLFTKVDDPEDLAGKIKLLMEDSALRKRLGSQARELVEMRYSWEQSAKKMDIIFQRLAA